MATKLTFISSHATGSAEKSNERQSVRGSSTEATKSTVRRKKEFKVRSSSSNVLSQPPRKTSILPKGLLRQYSPTLIWQKSDSPKVISAYSTLTAAPLPSPPKNELQNTVARRTIARNPDIFKHTTPIKVDAFEKNLKDHPNQPFVQSVVRSLRNGFWPWADTANHPLPTTHDGSHQRQPTTSKVKTDFIRQQRDEEVELERWSKPFGKKLLPGMHASPITAVPKSTPGKYRLIIDQSRGPHALNSTIPKSQVKVKLDTIHDLGTTLIHVRKKHPKRKIVLIKSDVKSAYRLPPMHPLWQIKQAVSVDGQFHIDRCNTFGNRGGGWNWDSVISLVNWIGTEKKKITDLLGYVDDNFGWEFAGNTKYYKPYKKHMPTKQTRLLQLLDELGIPHDENKQLSGPSLPILGYEVDANAMTVKVPDEKKAKIIQSLRNYAHEGTSYTLKELQSVAGSTSAVLNLYPQLRPGLRGLFDEMAGKEEPSTKLMVTKPVARSLSKLADHLERAQPVQIQQKK
ncbi:hypothetical protein L208DRAFT_1397668 [Tricholoma matsutake]|nr:hypothetical protein L208DRAFT_1397668 [Tricholoma matsutake 945]